MGNAAHIESVDYLALPGRAQELANTGVDPINTGFQEVFNELENMHQDWYGQKYHTLVAAFNQIIPSIHELLTLIIVDIPSAMNQVAKNYALADGVQPAGFQEEGVRFIQELNTTNNDVGLRFKSEAVLNFKDKMLNRLNTIINSDLNQYENIFLNVRTHEWQSDAAEAFGTKLSSIKNDLIHSVQDISTLFDNLIAQSQEDIEAAESANTVEN